MNAKQTRREFLRTAALSAAALGLPGICRGQRKKKKPNFVIILSLIHI